ncbi:MAG: thiosulfohydrolase SoxB [Methylococcales bacterium]|jgi:sulfur-oxidizing protein SoxB|nr:thiosulfohydrolase SoxB [Methylococcales bacterium]MBT7409905.1 thiosulfohydrolase SoxB [Methylococcales bacterium]
MAFSRREFMQIMGIAIANGLITKNAFSSTTQNYYDYQKFGNVSLMHFTDCHAQLLPIYFREPDVNIGTGESFAKAPHIVGNDFLKQFNLSPYSLNSHAFTSLDYVEAARRYGKVGGFAHMATLIKNLTAERGAQNVLLMDGGDTWQGSATAYWSKGQDMVEACNLLGVDVMTGHWEFTYHEAQIRKNIEKFNGEFVAQNVKVKDEALFDGAEAFDEETGHTFKPYTIKKVGGKNIAVIGQSFPYTPIANPRRFIDNWSFGIREAEMQTLVDEIRQNEDPDAVVLLSHNGMDVDLKMASRVTGIDAIFGGHTHDAIPQPIVVKNSSGQTIVTNAGSNGKFLAVLDMNIKNKRVVDYKYRLLPIFSNLLVPDASMSQFIQKSRAPYLDKLNQTFGYSDRTLYRRGNFNGTFDQVICDSMTNVLDAQIALSPGFRWGTTVLPGQKITMEHIMDQTAITYPETYVREMSGNDLKIILEDVCDNLFNNDPYLRQGGDMVRLSGMDYVCDPTAKQGQRITNMTLDNGKSIEANKSYKVAGWASVSAKSPGQPIWDVVSTYLKDKKVISFKKINHPKLKNIANNPGITNYCNY